jgi:hypothetical protein
LFHHLTSPFFLALEITMLTVDCFNLNIRAIDRCSQPFR